jgi:RNA polymerase primary sigma factor/RNA polymerase sigma factor
MPTIRPQASQARNVKATKPPKVAEPAKRPAPLPSYLTIPFDRLPAVKAAAETLLANELGQPIGLEELPPLHSLELLTADEERLLFVRIKTLKMLADTLAEEAPLFRGKGSSHLLMVDRLLSEATRLRNRVVQANLRLVVALARKHVSARLSHDEILSEAHASLIHAVDKFDISRGNKFSTYATRAVINNLNHFANRFRRQNRFFGAAEAEFLGTLHDHRAHGVREEGLSERANDEARELLATLDPERQAIIRARFGFEDTDRSPSLKSVGRHLGVSRERVRHLEAAALAELRLTAGRRQVEDLLPE